METQWTRDFGDATLPPAHFQDALAVRLEVAKGRYDIEDNIVVIVVVTGIEVFELDVIHQQRTPKNKRHPHSRRHPLLRVWGLSWTFCQLLRLSYDSFSRMIAAVGKEITVP
eukprot:1448536-Pyramimonas_sp.AAC.1